MNIILRNFEKLHKKIRLITEWGYDLQAIQTTILVCLTAFCLIRTTYFIIVGDLNQSYIHINLLVVLLYYTMSFNEVLQEDVEDE